MNLGDISVRLKLLTTDGRIIDPTLYAHSETVSLASGNFFQLKTTPADGAGITLSASVGSTGRYLLYYNNIPSRFVYSLSNVRKILSCTINIVYRAYTGGGTVYLNADIHVWDRYGNTRATIATNVCPSSNLGSSWATYVSQSYTVSDYTVVDPTDYLVISIYINVTSKKTGQYAYLSVDNSSLPETDQTRSTGWYLATNPSVVTHDATDVSLTSARLNGEVVDTGGAPILERGFEWGYSSGSYTYSWTETGQYGTGTFSYVVTNLNPGSRVYFRAKARNGYGWNYGFERVFTIGLPSVVTHDATDVSLTSARLNGEVVSIGDSVILERGFEWGYSSGSYTYSWTETGQYGTGTFSYVVTNLNPGSRVYFRAKARNGYGWNYGFERSFCNFAGWSYRKSHIINPASGAGINYPINIKVYYGSGTDNGGNVYLSGKCRQDFGDIRFTASDGTTLLDYWMEKMVPGNYASFWVKIPVDLSTNPVTIYIYYGNPNATRDDNPHMIDIWSLREHQSYSDYYPNFAFLKSNSGIIRVDSYTGGESSLGQGALFIIMPKSYLNGKRVRIYWNVYFSYSYAYDLAWVYVLDGELKRDQTVSAGTFLENVFNKIQLLKYTSTYWLGWQGWRVDLSSVVDLSSFTSNYVTLLVVLTDAWAALTTILDVDCVAIANPAGDELIRYEFGESVVMEQTGTYEDYGLYRKYVSPEPSHGAWGSEEVLVPGVTETKTAMSFPMYYLSKPTSSQELISKVSGATIAQVANELPRYLIKKGKANELRSKWSTG